MGSGPKPERGSGEPERLSPDDIVSIESICQFLVGKPFRVSVRDLPFVTMQQVKKLFFCERDESGLPKWMGSGDPGPTYEELFKDTWRRRGANQDQQDRLWAAFLEHQQRRGTEDEWRTLVDGIMEWQAQSTSP